MAITTVLTAYGCWLMLWNNGVHRIVTIREIETVLLAAAGAGWLVFALIGLIRYRAFVLSLIVPVLLVATLLINLTDLPQSLAWRKSKAAMTQAATDCAKNPHGRQIGVYTILTVQEVVGGCALSTDVTFDGTVSETLGFVHLPNGFPPERPNVTTTYDHHDGPWYRYTQRLTW